VDLVVAGSAVGEEPHVRGSEHEEGREDGFHGQVVQGGGPGCAEPGPEHAACADGGADFGVGGSGAVVVSGGEEGGEDGLECVGSFGEREGEVAEKGQEGDYQDADESSEDGAYEASAEPYRASE